MTWTRTVVMLVGASCLALVGWVGISGCAVKTDKISQETTTLETHEKNETANSDEPADSSNTGSLPAQPSPSAASTGQNPDKTAQNLDEGGRSELEVGALNENQLKSVENENSGSENHNNTKAPEATLGSVGADMWGFGNNPGELTLFDNSSVSNVGTGGFNGVVNPYGLTNDWMNMPGWDGVLLNTDGSMLGIAGWPGDGMVGQMGSGDWMVSQGMLAGMYTNDLGGLNGVWNVNGINGLMGP